MNSKKKILLFSFFLGTIFMIIIFVLLFNWEIRHKVYRTVQYVPEEVIKLAIANDLRINNFQGINNKLSNHLKLVKWHAPGRNLLLQGLLRNILFSIESASSEQVTFLKPFFSELANTYPDLYPARLWLARALQYENVEEAFIQLENAFRLSSSDDRTYRLAFEMAIRNQLHHKLNQWCSRYQYSTFGGPRPIDTNNHGVGLRKMVIEIFSENFETSQLIMNAGVQLRDERAYEFPFKEGIKVNKIKLHLNFVPGISVRLTKMELYLNGEMRRIIENPLMTSTNAVHLPDGQIITTRRKKETINIHSLDYDFGRLDKIVMHMKIQRIGLSTPNLCMK